MCALCHEKQAKTQQASHHAQALRLWKDSPFGEKLAGQSIRERGGVAFSYERDSVVASKDAEHVRMPFEWAFGAGSKAYTAVGRVEGKWVEHRISWYRESGKLGLTPGHAATPSADALSGLGIVQREETITRCFNCHASGVKPGPDLSAMRAGVTCERCHGPGSRHVTAARGRTPLRHTIFNAGGMPAKAIVQVCGECHRSPDNAYKSAMPELEDPLSVRFAPVGFMASRCFQKATRFSCISCHDPHDNPRPRADLHYVAVCRGCHASPPEAKSSCARSGTANCLECHMKTASPVPNLTFTDHRIRVYLE